MLAEGAAWDTLSWFAALIAMASFLSKFGLIGWFSNNVVQVVSGMGLSWQPAFLITTLLYFYSHYLFASGAAHIGAMYTAFLSVATACGTPPIMAALVLGTSKAEKLFFFFFFFFSLQCFERNHI